MTAAKTDRELLELAATDNGAAFLLAVKLRLSVSHINNEFVAVETVPPDDGATGEWWWYEHYANCADECEATRKAITRAAASIGEKS